MSKPFITRFAPSPTGFLHLGHAYSALLGFRTARKHSGQFILRIEDIDTTRCRPEFEAAIFEDLSWLGLSWQEPVRRQSDHLNDYKKALNRLIKMDLVYPCFCTRAEIKAEIEKSQSAPHGLGGPLYPGTCRDFSVEDQNKKVSEGLPFAFRLNTAKAVEMVENDLYFSEKGKKINARPELQGDVVLARKDTPTSYNLSAVLDDHLQGVSHIIRGEDLLHATHIHCLLQRLLGLRPPEYFHHKLLVGPDGRRFAKRDKSLTLQTLRREGKTVSEIDALIKSFGGDFEELPF